MSSMVTQLTEAYRREEALYMRIRDLVHQQQSIMAASPDPTAVLQLCQEVEGLLEEIAGIENDIGPLKQQWWQTKPHQPGELDAILGNIQDAIEQTTDQQNQVRHSLLQHVNRQDSKTGSARANVSARRARLTYG